MITEDEQVRIAELIARATEHAVPLAEVERQAKQLIKGGVEHANWNIAQTIALECGYQVTYTHEEQRQCICRHISISVWKHIKPNNADAQQILTAFGFINDLQLLPRWFSQNNTVVEFLEPLDGNMEQIKRKPH
jgi:hypothetical protein